jgi:5-methyltetrahydrofolate--homocysteine methyltransferase
MLELSRFIIFDGAMGTMLQSRGLKAGGLPELLNLTDGDVVRSIHEEYVRAGADVVTTNTFGANARKLSGNADVREVVTAGVRLAKESGAKYVALDVGPTGELMEPMGELSFEDAVSIFKEQISAGAAVGADLILIETMSDLLETKAAMIAAKECCRLPVFVTMTYGENGRTFLGTDPAAATITLCALGAAAVGVNCSLGPSDLLPVVKTILKYSTVPVIVQANAGLPSVVNGETVFGIKPQEYAESVKKMIDMGVSIVGGCCGTNPGYIRRIKELTTGRSPVRREIPKYTAFTSARKSVVLDGSTAVIGERINPTGKKALKEALRNGDIDYIIDEALKQEDCGADILDVNAGLPELDEPKVLSKLVKEIQAVTALPLQIDSSDSAAIEAAVRVYNGKPIINSVNGGAESMETILPIAKKYGAAVVALTLDENGIPETAEERLKIAERILERAMFTGIPKNDVIIDCLVLTASTNQAMVLETIRAVRIVKERLGLKTVLGVSNVSFGLPDRELVNSTFLAAAFGAGLDMPILNPLSESYMKVVAAYKVLNNEDKGAEIFIKEHSQYSAKVEQITVENKDIRDIILNGRKGNIVPAVSEALKSKSVMEVINEYFIPTLDETGRRYESGQFFLPQLMAAAETAKAGFGVLYAAGEKSAAKPRGKILLATVKGDVHDIGKNIVRMLLENYGYEVIDLGKDVDPEKIVQAAVGQKIKLVGLSALMTTTVRYMEETVKALKNAGAESKIMVGGAVLNEEYSRLVGADYYAKDAAEATRIAAEVFENTI